MHVALPGEDGSPTYWTCRRSLTQRLFYNKATRKPHLSCSTVETLLRPQSRRFRVRVSSSRNHTASAIWWPANSPTSEHTLIYRWSFQVCSRNARGAIADATILLNTKDPQPEHIDMLVSYQNYIGFPASNEGPGPFLGSTDSNFLVALVVLTL